MSLYEKNTSALLLKNPSLAHELSNLPSDIPYEIFMENEALETLNLIHTSTFAPLYATKPQAVLEAQKEQFKLFQEYPYLYFLEWAMGHC